MRKLICLLVTLAAASISVAAETARMQLPDGFREQAEFFNASGFRGRQKGVFEIGPYRGEFNRKDSRLDILDSKFVSNKAKAALALVQPETGERADAACRQTKGSMTLKIVTFDPKKLRYECEMDIGGGPARLAVGQAKGTAKEKFLALDLRSGSAEFQGLELTIQSVHRYHGSSFTSQAPVGYLIGSGDETVAAVELTDTSPSVYLLRDLDPEVAYRAMFVAMTVALLPAELE
jgi:hypothetical protein